MSNQTPRPRPKQIFPDQLPRQEETQYEAPRYQHNYEKAQEPYYGPYAPTPQREPEPKRDNVPAMIFGVLFAIAAVAATVLFFLLSLIHI